MKKITVTDTNNWRAGKHHFQTLPKALRFEGIEDDKLLKAYNESLEAFKPLQSIEKMPNGDFMTDTVSGRLYSRDTDRLKMLAFETLLKAWMMHVNDIYKALEMAANGTEPERKAIWRETV